MSSELEHRQLTNFERAFAGGTAGCRRDCECGKEYYNPGGGWDFEEGELEALFADPNATALDYSVGSVVIDNVEYVNGCDCWHSKAFKIIAWLDHHRHQVTDFFKYEKKSKEGEAKEAPTVDDEPQMPHSDL